MRIARLAFEHHELISGAVSKLLVENAVIRLPPGEKPMVMSPLGVVPKRGTNMYRLTVNMRYVNRHLGKKAFKFEGLKDQAYLAERGDHAVSYDLMSGYYHVGLHPRSRTFVGFKWIGEYYVYNCLPFGLSTAPWVFSKVKRELVMLWRREGISVLPYFDDFVFMRLGFWACARLARQLEGDFVQVGIYADQCSEVPHDLGQAKKAARLRRGHCRGQVRGPVRPMGGFKSVGGLDLSCQIRSGPCSEIGERNRDGAIHALFPGTSNVIIHKAFTCFD